ncbi:hypothetical protein Ahy_B01g051667 [Arachis hypogaea]|uniref:Protein FAR1-RELATED SEQUENCE n=1 Tax=Arachis hypogaea TaxID=3818 RepID=A0A445AMJ2_ARAHY|nr:hypothetical protein Ahy_B01g051667 [Arachis hypogaea]
MNESTSNQLNECDYSSETHQFDETSCVVNERFVLKVGMIFETLEEAAKFYKQRAEMLKQHRELSMFVRRTIETHKEAGIRPSKTYQSFVAAAGSNRELELYNDRHIWIPVYLDHHFWARMRSTQRSESMHSFFNKFITQNSSLRQFVKQYNNCLASKEQAEREFDAADFYTVIPGTTKSAIEAQFQHSRGILCRHSLRVLSFERVDNVAPKYILKRWSKNIKRRHTHIKSSQDKPLLEPRSKRFDELVFRLHNICEFAYEFEELTRILHRAFDKVMAEMEEYQERSKGKSLLMHEEATLSNVNDLQSPPRVKTRGRPKNRLGSNLEKKISNAM